MTATFEGLNRHGLYSADPEEFGRDRYLALERDNWFFTVAYDEAEKQYYMADTYGGVYPNRIPLTEENIGLFRLVFDKREVEPITQDEYYMYDSNDTYKVRQLHEDEEGFEYYRKKGAEKQIEQQIDVLEVKEYKLRKKLERLMNEQQETKKTIIEVSEAIDNLKAQSRNDK